ncbi:nucleoside triphosphate pyrophosphohydrolase [Bengtsoniella intestinalis]|uniref:nucleoside triphosphate pyrophosphohydrolase n=1 Tax=Bengtsoniella intestinalis TaxID=3073143 RepID=UPI00391F102D
MVNFQGSPPYDWEDLLEILRLLRSPEGCPWDREQTHESIRRNFLEETYEALEAIDADDPAHICEELGDVLLQVGFHAIMEEERGRLDPADVVHGVCQKLLFRHPHVFGALEAKDGEQALVNWEVQKKAEKGHKTTADSLEAVSAYLPALWRAEKISKKSNQVGFCWDSILGGLDKLEEEVGELREAILEGKDPQGPHGAYEELGDVLFMAARIAQMQGLDPEQALHDACGKFNSRFRTVETLAGDTDLTTLSEQALVELWQQAKEQS